MRNMRTSGRNVSCLRNRPHPRLCKHVLRGLLVLWLTSLCAQAPLIAWALPGTGHQNGAEKDPIRLVLQTSKKTYRVGDPIIITTYLENVSDKTYLVGSYLNEFDLFTQFQVVELKVVNERNRPLKRSQLFLDPFPSELNKSMAEKLSKNYVALRPRMTHGFKVSGNVLRPAGRYRYTAIYRELQAPRWTEAERNALPIPIWMQPLVSNTVTITVLP